MGRPTIGFALPIIILASCAAPPRSMSFAPLPLSTPHVLTIGPVIEGRPPLGLGHDWEGLVGVEAAYGWVALLWGIDHPEDGVETEVVRLSFRVPVPMPWGSR